MVAFFPWLQIEEVTNIGDWELSPVTIKDLTDSEDDLSIKQVLKPYHLNAKVQIRHAVILRHRRKGRFDILSKDEMSDYFLMGELLSFSATATRDFFGWTYTNPSSYALVIQAFQSNSDGMSVETRRRDGSTLSYIPGQYNLIIKPHYVHVAKMIFDKSLLEALSKAQNHDFWGNIHESIFCYLRANSDDMQTQLQAELMFALGAFERLFEVDNGKCELSAKAFVRTMNQVLLEEPKSTDIARPLEKMSAFESMREIWVRDLCISRGDLAHGRTKQKYKSIWSPHEHLLLASDIFPIALKSTLSTLNLYTISEDDQERLFYFDRRLRVATLYSTSGDSENEDFGWNEVRKSAVWDWQIKKEELIPPTKRTDLV